MQPNSFDSSRTSIAESANNAADFDPNVTFADGSRLINHPLDETYLSAPGDYFLEGMLPRAEQQVTAAMIEMAISSRKYAEFGFFRSLFHKSEYENAKCLAIEKQKNLRALVNSTPEHKAAFKRILTITDKRLKTNLANYLHQDTANILA